MLHGHFCPFSALGVKAGARAMKDLEVRQSTGMEEVLAIVETNNCFSDGVQIVTGCSFGNNALIYRDYGKTAFTLAKRSGRGIRISVKPNCLEEQVPEATQLFRTAVVERQATESDQAEVRKLWAEVAFKMLDIPDEDVFHIRQVRIEVPAYARIFASVRCSLCGESIMEPRARMKQGRTVCIPCAGEAYYCLADDGISMLPPQREGDRLQ